MEKFISNEFLVNWSVIFLVLLLVSPVPGQINSIIYQQIFSQCPELCSRNTHRIKETSTTPSPQSGALVCAVRNENCDVCDECAEPGVPEVSEVPEVPEGPGTQCTRYSSMHVFFPFFRFISFHFQLQLLFVLQGSHSCNSWLTDAYLLKRNCHSASGLSNLL